MRLWLIFAAAASCTASKVTVRDGAFMGKSQATSPWLGLLTSGWSLAGMSQDKKSQGLDNLASTMLSLAKSMQKQNPDPSMQAAVESISGIVENMKADVNATAESMQALIDKKLNVVHACNVRIPEAGNPSTTWTTGLNPTQQDVVSCRLIEANLYEASTNCSSMVTRCSTSEECCSPLLGPSHHQYCNTTVISESPIPLAATCHSKTKCSLDDLAAVKAIFQAKLDEIEIVEKACDDSRTGCASPLPDCSSSRSHWTLQKQVCDRQQKDFEQQYCDLAESVEGRWYGYRDCHDTAEAALKQEETVQQGLLPGLQQQYRGVLRIECLVDALGSADVAAKLEVCISKTYTAAEWPHLVALRTYTPLTGENSARICTDKLFAPGTDFFKEYFYSDIQTELIADGLGTSFCLSELSTSYCLTAADENTGSPPSTSISPSSRSTPGDATARNLFGLLQKRAHAARGRMVRKLGADHRRAAHGRMSHGFRK